MFVSNFELEAVGEISVNSLPKMLSELLKQYLDQKPLEQCGVDNQLISDINILCEQVNHLRDCLYRKFDYEQTWVDEGYSNAAQSISRTTHNSLHKVKGSLKRIEFLEEFPCVEKALLAHEISSDHVDHIANIYGNNFYTKYIYEDIDLILDNAKALTANEFSTVIKQYKYNIADIEEDKTNTSSFLERYEQRTFGMWRTPSGDYMLEGCLDQATGELVEKTLSSVNSYIWENSSKEAREDYHYGKSSVDAIKLIFNGFLSSDYGVTHENKANALADIKENNYHFHPAITCDVTIDLDLLKTTEKNEKNNTESTKNSTSNFLASLLNRKTPLTRAYSKKYLQQLTCDSAIAFPIYEDGKLKSDSSRVRTAPKNLKRTLALEHPYCYIEGCACPAKWCDAHHLKHWAHGGLTTKENMVLLCPKHHTKLHHDKNFEKTIHKKLYNPNKTKILT